MGHAVNVNKYQPTVMRHGGTDRLYERCLAASTANHTQSDVAAGDNNVGYTNMAGRVSCILGHKMLIYRTESIMKKKTVSLHNLERVSVLSAALCVPAAEISSVQWWSWS